MNEFSYYDKISKDKLRLEFQTHNLNLISALLLAITIFIYLPSINIFLKAIISIATVFPLTILCHKIRSYFSNSYRDKIQRIKNNKAEIKALREKIEGVFQKYPWRDKGQQFKVAYSLTGKSLAKLEEALAVGMLREDKEVFVTAFMKKNKAVRVTATIGREGQCFNSDDVSKWGYHIERLNCDEILQYHNHPDTNNKTRPSPNDYFSTKKLKLILGTHSDKLRSLIVFWNEIREWRVLEYNENKKYEIIRAFDIKKA